MNGLWSIRHKQFSIAALGVALITMPFSITLCHFSLIIYLLCWVFEGRWNEKLSIVKSSAMLQLILAFCVLQLVGLSYTENTASGWFSMEKKIFLFLVPLALGTSMMKYQPKEIRWMFYAFTAACLVGTLICSFSVLSALQLDHVAGGQISYFDSSPFKELNPAVSNQWLFFSYVSLANGISIHPTYFSLYLAFCCVFLLHELVAQTTYSGKRRIILITVLLYFTLFIVCLSSRIVTFSLITLYLIAGANLFVKHRSGQAATLCLLVFIILAVSYFNPVSRYRSWQELALSSLAVQEHSLYKTSTEIRASLWWLGWKTFLKNNMLWGSGTGDVEASIQKVSAEHGVTNVLNSFDPHNQYLYILVAHGVVGFAIFIMMLIFFFVPAWWTRNYLMLGFGFLFVTLFLTETALELQKGITLFAVVFSLLSFQAQSFQLYQFNLKNFSARS